MAFNFKVSEENKKRLESINTNIASTSNVLQWSLKGKKSEQTKQRRDLRKMFVKLLESTSNKSNEISKKDILLIIIANKEKFKNIDLFLNTAKDVEDIKNINFDAFLQMQFVKNLELIIK